MNNQSLGRSIATALFSAVIAGTWDAWWHGALGRESFWSPPHLLLYVSVITAIVLGIYGWYRTRKKLWRRLAIFLAIVPISAPFDELWHRFFGVENVSSPLIVWSPPHLALIVAISGSLIMLLPVLRKDESRDAQRLFGSLVFASVLSLLMFLAAPVQPTGAYELLGFWGAGILAGLLVGVFLMANRWIPGIGGATITAMAYLVITATSLGERIAPGVNVPPHAHPPSWLLVFSIIVPALSIDLLSHFSGWMKGVIAALLWSVILYGVAWIFFEPQFQYGFGDGIIAIVASVIGGLFAGLVMKSKIST